MVFFFTCVDERYTVYMGKDKYENEELLKYGWPEDVWFHVDNWSSAHVYLRMPTPEVTTREVLAEMLAAIPEEVKAEMCQLVRGNSIEGCKQPKVDIVYTPFHNLDKRANMDDGQVGFKDSNARYLVRHVARELPILKRIEKTRREGNPDLFAEKEQRMDEEKHRRKKKASQERERKKEEDRAVAENQAAIDKEQRAYDNLEANRGIEALYDEDSEEDFL